jgi:hypothetical protein
VNCRLSCSCFSLGCCWDDTVGDAAFCLKVNWPTLFAGLELFGCDFGLGEGGSRFNNGVDSGRSMDGKAPGGEREFESDVM